jgi:hypothetical protein
VTRAGHVDDPCSLASCLDLAEQELGEQDMTKMVGCELQFNAALIGGEVLDGHDAGVVDQNVQLVDGSIDLCCGRAHGVKVVKLDSYEGCFDLRINLLDFRNDRVNLGGGARKKKQLRRTCGGERQSRLRAQSAVAGASDEDWEILEACDVFNIPFQLTCFSFHFVLKGLHHLLACGLKTESRHL